MFKVGDKVVFKSWEELEHQFGVDVNDNINCDYCFTPEMRYLCGQTIVIKGLEGNRIYGHHLGWSISTDMIKHFNKYKRI
jgi:hypothetical protein